MGTVTLPARTTKIGKNCVKVGSSGFERIEPTATLARKSLKSAIVQQIRYTQTRTYRRAADGTIFALYFADGWKYDIVGTDHIARGYPATTFLYETEYEEVLPIMERHVAQYA